jgi:hypothetical protein
MYLIDSFEAVILMPHVRLTQKNGQQGFKSALADPH